MHWGVFLPDRISGACRICQARQRFGVFSSLYSQLLYYTPSVVRPESALRGRDDNIEERPYDELFSNQCIMSDPTVTRNARKVTRRGWNYGETFCQKGPFSVKTVLSLTKKGLKVFLVKLTYYISVTTTHPTRFTPARKSTSSSISGIRQGIPLCAIRRTYFGHRG